jgi:hypothetical protein
MFEDGSAVSVRSRHCGYTWRPDCSPPPRSFLTRQNGQAASNKRHYGGQTMAENKVTVEKKDNGKWACFLHLPGHDAPIDLGKEFKDEERAETWLDVSEATTAIDMMTRKYTAK